MQHSVANGRAYSSQLAEHDNGSEGMRSYCCMCEGVISYFSPSPLPFFPLSVQLARCIASWSQASRRRQVPELHDYPFFKQIADKKGDVRFLS